MDITAYAGEQINKKEEIMACTTSVPVAVGFDECNPVNAFSEITRIYVRGRGNPFTDWSDPTEWTTNLDDTATVGTEIRTLWVTADLPAPTVTPVDRSGGRQVTPAPTRIINLDVDELSQVNYDFLRDIELNGGNFSFWYQDFSGYLFGGNAGVEGTLFLSHAIGRDRTALQLLQGTVTWIAQQSPERIVSPIVVV